jgi:transcriptional regulator with XRE-family HTH domain
MRKITVRSTIVKCHIQHDDLDMKEREQRYGVELGKWVRQRRDALKMTQEQVWSRMEMPTGESNWIAQLENGRRKRLPDFDVLNALSEALRVPVTEVLRVVYSFRETQVNNTALRVHFRSAIVCCILAGMRTIAGRYRSRLQIGAAFQYKGIRLRTIAESAGVAFVYCQEYPSSALM